MAEVLDTIWEVDDELWAIIEPLLRDFWPRKGTGRPPANWRKCINGIIYQMRTGCQWNQLPKEFGDDSTIHRWFQRWVEAGILQQIWAILIQRCDELQGVEWKWQAADGSLAKARFGGSMLVRTPRIGRKMARKPTSSSRAKVGLWRSKPLPPTGMTVPVSKIC